jgi:hypothetical protein
MTAKNPELLSENLSRFENLTKLESLLAVSAAAIQTLYRQLQEHDKIGDDLSLAGCTDTAGGLEDLFLDMRCIAREMREECFQDE